MATSVKAKKSTRKKTTRQLKHDPKSGVKKTTLVPSDIDFEFIGSSEESPELRNTRSRSRIRSQLETEITEFLQSGGTIEQIAPNVMADPPSKPKSQYGKGSI